MNYQVIDNFLPNKNFNLIKEMIFKDNFNWFYQPDVNYQNQNSENMLFYFTHLFYGNDKPLSPHYNLIKENLISFLNVNSLIRIKANLYPNQHVKKTNGYHTDYDYPHKGAIFYLNTNNGRTLLNEQIKIDSIENRILLFDSYLPHDSENCTDQKVRVNININYF
tara:strand:- start:1124 stop:1618 length:495 start_codon:yes stop_codon:yes gene_type:complete